MPYIGNEVGNRFVASKAASVYSGDGSTTAFTLEHAVGSDEDILVSVDGVIQEPSVAYAVSSGTTLTFTAAPSSNSGNNIFVYYLFRTVATVDHPSTSSLQATDGTFTAGITGTLQTAAQTNITSVGTLATFRSTGIDDNADALAITIDSSENVLVKKTATNYQTVGVEAKSTGQLWATADGNNPILAVRNSSDGKIQTFYKDTTEIGNIGTVNGDLNIFSSTSGHAGLRFANGYVAPANNAGNISDNTADLGIAAYRFKSLFLSSGIFLGGTASENELTDYEEGTFTPVMEGTSSTPSITYTLQSGYYTKIGKQVTWMCDIRFSAWTGGSGTLRINQLPFTSNGMAGGDYQGNVHSSYMYQGTQPTNGGGYHLTGENKAYFTRVSDGYSTVTANSINNTSGHLMLGGTFFTNS